MEGKLYDSNGKVILCKCGQPAGVTFVGKETFVAYCTSCYCWMPLPEEPKDQNGMD